MSMKKEERKSTEKSAHTLWSMQFQPASTVQWSCPPCDLPESAAPVSLSPRSAKHGSANPNRDMAAPLELIKQPTNLVFRIVHVADDRTHSFEKKAHRKHESANWLRAPRILPLALRDVQDRDHESEYGGGQS